LLQGVSELFPVSSLGKYSLRPFGYYCLAAGLFALLWINLT
jgi:undecaprenyl pyrophosphate phosphatase UppP